ncbi:recombinase family protein (plasmid) [Paraclostridium bifermentans]|uniref:Recombinase family protein n=1 Tax=Paraclostridium bifermentans TaxID=1490 RepID=A0A5P3XKH3_PARBF|nr:recombinase family protein [Paraclostridium bifermentans]QEZ70813.1 recombinase family protein [Paraclostridium bifermentans]
MTYGYCRVSTRHQSLHRQIDALVDYGVNERFIFSDKYTGKTLNREGLNELLSIIKPGDTLVVKEIDRLGRNRKETKALILFFIKENIELVCLEMPYLKEFIIDKINDSEGFLEIMANALLDVILEVAEQERKKIISRTSEGRRKAVLEGRKFGRNSKVLLEDFKVYYEKFLRREMKAKDIQRELSISKQCYYDYVNRLKVKYYDEF